MPHYDYQCEKCTEIFEVAHPMSGPVGILKCPVCGTGEVHKVFLQSPGIFIWWRDARTSPTGDASGMQPIYLRAVKNQRHEENVVASLGGV